MKRKEQNQQVIDCTGKTCPKCGAPLIPMTAKSGSMFCGCPNCDAQLRGAQTTLEPFKKGVDYTEQIDKVERLKLGDGVVVDNSASEYYGREGKITGFDPIDNTKALVEWRNPEGSELVCYIDIHDLKKLYTANSELRDIYEKEAIIKRYMFDDESRTSSFKKVAPFKSPQQEAWMWINEPEIAKKWYKEHGHHLGYKSWLKNKKRKKKGKLLKVGMGLYTVVVFKRGVTKDSLYGCVFNFVYTFDKEHYSRVINKLLSIPFFAVTNIVDRNGRRYCELQPYNENQHVIAEDLDLQGVFVDSELLTPFFPSAEGVMYVERKSQLRNDVLLEEHDKPWKQIEKEFGKIELSRYKKAQFS